MQVIWWCHNYFIFNPYFKSQNIGQDGENLQKF